MKRQYPGLLGLTVGKRIQREKVRTHSGLVLQCVVQEKETKPKKPLPKQASITDRVHRRSAAKHTRAVRAKVLIPVDVIAASTGEVLAGPPSAASVFAKPTEYQVRSVKGCLAARVRWGVRVGWLTAAHVACASSNTFDDTAITRIWSRKFNSPNGRTLGYSIPKTCWPRISDEAWGRVDAGLVSEDDPRYADKNWFASQVRRTLSDSEITTEVRFYFSSPQNNVQPLTFASKQPEGIHRFKVWTGNDLLYPSFLFFQGNAVPGDSGSLVWRISSSGIVMAGVLVGRIQIGDVWGAAVMSFDDICIAMRRSTGNSIALYPR